MTIIRERLDTASAIAVDDGIYEVTLITEGKGSSGVYKRPLLETYGSATFGPGVLNHYDHLDEWSDASARSVRTAASKILESWYAIEDGVAKVKAKIQVVPSEREFIDFFHEELGLSISVNGTAESDRETGDLNVTSFDVNDPYRSVDWVVAAGRGGKVDRKIQSYAATEGADPEKVARLTESFQRVIAQPENKPLVALAEDNEKKGMTLEKDVEARFDALESAIQALLTAKENEAQAKADANALAEARKNGAEAAVASEALIRDAGLFEFQEKSLREAAGRGEDISVAVEDAKKVALAAREAAGEKKPLVESGSTEKPAVSTEGYVFQYGGTN